MNGIVVPVDCQQMRSNRCFAVPLSVSVYDFLYRHYNMGGVQADHIRSPPNLLPHSLTNDPNLNRSLH